MYARGDRVLVEGVGGKQAIVRVWEDRGHGIVATSDGGYARLLRGEDAPLVGFPLMDVKDLVLPPVDQAANK
jgi:hypothetical protein